LIKVCKGGAQYKVNVPKLDDLVSSSVA